MIRIKDRSGEACAVVDPKEVVGIHGRPDGRDVELVYRGGAKALLTNVTPRHVFDAVHPSPSPVRPGK